MQGADKMHTLFYIILQKKVLYANDKKYMVNVPYNHFYYKIVHTIMH